MFTCEWLPLSIRPFISGNFYIILRSFLPTDIFTLFQFQCHLWSRKSRFHSTSFILILNDTILHFDRSQNSWSSRSGISNSEIKRSNKTERIFVEPRSMLSSVQNIKDFQILPLSDLQSMYNKIHSSFSCFWNLHWISQWITRFWLFLMYHCSIIIDFGKLFQRYQLWSNYQSYVLWFKSVHFLDKLCRNSYFSYYGKFLIYKRTFITESLNMK